MTHFGALAALIFLAALTPAPACAGGAICNLSSTPLVFGAYVPSSNSPSDFTSTIVLTCTASGAAPVAVRGTITLSGAGAHRLTDGAHGMRYQLYLDPARTILWGNGAGSGTVPVSGVASATTPFRQTLTVYGRILARQSGTMTGHYTDQFLAVLNY